MHLQYTITSNFFLTPRPFNVSFAVAPYPNVSGVVHMNRHVGGVYAFHTADGDALGFVLVLISRFPEGLCGAIS